MDIRDTEEFKGKQREIIRKRAAEEICAVNILAEIHRNNLLKDKVYAEYKIGSQGLMTTYMIVAIGVSSFTLTGKFRSSFPRLSGVIGKSYIARIALIYAAMTIGRSYEQYRVENKLNKEAYEEYTKAYKYFVELKARKLASLSVSQKISLLFGIDVNEYFK